MPGLLQYLLPALAFLIVASLVLVGVSFWTSRFGGRARALSGRLKSIAVSSAASGGPTLETAGQTSFGSWLARRIPAVGMLSAVLVRAGSDKSAEDVLKICAGAAVTMFLLLFFVLRLNPVLALLAGLVCAVVPIQHFVIKANGRRKKFEEQLPDALDFMARALRAGHGLTIAMGMVADELPEPIGPEFKITFEEINFGLPFNQAVSNLAERLDSSDLNFFVVALLIQRETGGNLTELLGGLAKTVRDRIKLHGKVRVLAAEGKFSGVLLGALPFLLGVILSFLNPEYMSPLWTTPAGTKLIITGLVMMVFGFAWISKVIEIKV